MKRSEMVNLIWDAINELEDGEHILQRIEAAGMLPPKIERELRTLNGKYVGYQIVFAWEPEEKKEEDDDEHFIEKEWRNRYGE